jgi:hypothetical protein
VLDDALHTNTMQSPSDSHGRPYSCVDRLYAPGFETCSRFSLLAASEIKGLTSPIRPAAELWRLLFSSFSPISEVSGAQIK